jgi:mannose-6-phosphate isomerase-like protein (cupin superfamily)
MENPGDTIENPVMKHRVTFLKTTQETGGQVLSMEYTIFPGGRGTLDHIHLKGTEDFKVLSGTLGVANGDPKNPVMLKEGESAHIPIRVPHRFFNPSDTEAVTFLFDLKPAGRFETFLRTYYGLAREGRINASGAGKNFFQWFVLVNITDTYALGIPARLQQIIFWILSRIGLLLGYRTIYPRFQPGGKG